MDSSRDAAGCRGKASLPVGHVVRFAAFCRNAPMVGSGLSDCRRSSEGSLVSLSRLFPNINEITYLNYFTRACRVDTRSRVNSSLEQKENWSPD